MDLECPSCLFDCLLDMDEVADSNSVPTTHQNA
jgi:hypothetical protein